MTGWFKTKRGITKHHLFKGKPERLAIWLWLLDNVAWADTTQNVFGLEVPVPRGHVLAAQRRIAEELGVGRQVVRSFFEALEKEGMVEVIRPTHLDGQGANPVRTLISVCNWDRYQLQGSTKNPEDNPADNPQKKNTLSSDRSVSTSSVAPHMSPAPQETRSRKPQAKRFDEFWNNAYPHKEKKIARGKCEAKYRLLVASGVDEEAIIGGARAYARSERVRDGIVCNPMTWLNARRWEDENAEIIPHPASRSPATSASPADPFKVTRNGQAQGQSRAFARRQEALARELDRGSRDDPSASLLPARGQ